jgi:enoyl-CoA hydratase/carnithine racemase
MTSVVEFNEQETKNGHKVGVITLNSPKSLNALSLEMIHLIFFKLDEWAANSDVVMVIMQGSGEKAFCAGGDVVDLYHACKNEGEGNFSPLVEQFFKEEYQLDFKIHTYNKPIMLWGHGIIMGGGLGLMAGASHRVVTERSRIAMPEITIGLYPDVGGSYFLNRMPDGCGLFLGLTGASINATDALYVNLADHFVASGSKEALIETILSSDWTLNNEDNHNLLTSILQELSQKDLAEAPLGNIQNHKELIASLANCQRVSSAVNKILDEQTDDKWFSIAQSSLKHGSAISAHIVFEQLQRGKGQTLAQCFQMELGLSVRCAANGEFAEGVRALLIDKDQSPNWKFESVEDVDSQFMELIFSDPWAGHPHPLQQLL